MLERLPIVAVLGSGSLAWTERAEPLGRWLAECGCHLITGGGGGVMAAVSRAFVEVEPRRGRCIGILPGAIEEGSYSAPSGYPNESVEIAIRTHLPWSGEHGTHERSRNHLNVLSADFVIALPGGAGTASELRLAVRYARPTLLWASEEELAAAPAEIPRVSSFEQLRRRVGSFLAGA